MDKVVVRAASRDDVAEFAQAASDLIAEAAKVDNVHNRAPEYIARQMEDGRAVLAIEDGVLIGFCYYRVWADKAVSHSALVVRPDRRRRGVGMQMKHELFEMAARAFPGARAISRTTSDIVLGMNEQLGFRPCALTELTTDPEFWHFCERACDNFAAVNAPGATSGEVTPLGTRCCCKGMCRTNTS